MTDDDTQAQLERAYRTLLHVYPRDYRESRGDELVGTLLDAAEPGRVRPSWREALPLVAEGLRVRTGADAPARVVDRWGEAARTAAVVAGLGLVVLTLPDALVLLRRDLVDGAGVSQIVVLDLLAPVLLLLTVAAAHVTTPWRAALVGVLPGVAAAAQVVQFGGGVNGRVVMLAALYLIPCGLLLVSGRRPAPGRRQRWRTALPVLALAPAGLATVALAPLAGTDCEGAVAGVAGLLVLGGAAACLVWAVVVDPHVAMAFGMLPAAGGAWLLMVTLVSGGSGEIWGFTAVLVAVGAAVAGPAAYWSGVRAAR